MVPVPEQEHALMTGEGRLADQVFSWITEQIVLGGLRPGQWISETEVADTLGVSRSPVHQALQVLAAEHLVDVIPRRGTIIADVDAREVDDLYRTRAFVDGEIARLAVDNAPEDLPDRIRAIVADLQNAIGDDKRYYETTARFWNALYEPCGNSVLVDLSKLLWRRSIPIRGILLRLPGRQQRTYEFFRDLGLAVAQRDSESAKEKTAALFDDIRISTLERCFLPIGDGTETIRLLASRHAHR